MFLPVGCQIKKKQNKNQKKTNQDCLLRWLGWSSKGMVKKDPGIFRFCSDPTPSEKWKLYEKKIAKNRLNWSEN